MTRIRNNIPLRTLAPHRTSPFRLQESDIATRTMLEHPEMSMEVYRNSLKTSKPKHASKLNLGKTLAATAAAYSVPGLALAKGGEFGALEGGVPALVHPISMGLLYGTTLYAGYLGWQWRRIRTIQDDIKALKSQQPALKTTEFSSPVGPLIDSLKSKLGEGNDADVQSDIAALQAYAPVDSEVQALAQTQKDLRKGDFRDRHNNVGSLLLAAGVFFAIEGPVNTWMRTGKLFPGPHLFAGAAVTVLWAAAAALVPAMQKGNKFAKDLHILLNAANVALFSWQIASGIPIVQKVLEIKFGIKL
eukprot:CAMPEP_0167755126 /NCGR_PEP_ID=MMETSP0110_2-20121227/8649_1 /TAXON_ID=629695 /ORGANISM="Gymnochlora sp., Strain CCMP2014" /LENGTH=302 /DNA_ID=CAMNT_0007641075 /DNA_START=153 /DNA_END=1061 /DNA_ORIENTATION=+